MLAHQPKYHIQVLCPKHIGSSSEVSYVQYIYVNNSLVTGLYFFFANSPKRLGELKEFQELANVPNVNILHPATTRWLSLDSVVKRLLEQYNALILYFTDQAAADIFQASAI